jgi:hypothetical protein
VNVQGAHLIRRPSMVGLPGCVALVCAHGEVTSDEVLVNSAGWAEVRRLYRDLDDQFSDAEMPPEEKAAHVLHELLGRRTEARFGCSDGYLPIGRE